MTILVPVAQPEEQRPSKPTVGGSSPSWDTNDMTYNIKNSFQEALQTIIGKRPPGNLDGINHSKQLSDADFLRLQVWCFDNIRPKWGTGIGAIEAADTIVRNAIENGNIPEK